jgi:hypothetical protein
MIQPRHPRRISAFQTKRGRAEVPPMLTTATLFKSDGVGLSHAVPETFPNLSQMPICCRATINFSASAVHEFTK